MEVDPPSETLEVAVFVRGEVVTDKKGENRRAAFPFCITFRQQPLRSGKFTFLETVTFAIQSGLRRYVSLKCKCHDKCTTYKRVIIASTATMLHTLDPQY